MANDIFSRNSSSLQGAFSADSAMLSFADGLVALVQRLNFSYAQTITRLYDITNSSAIYYVAGRTQGQMGVDRVIGPSGSVCTFYSTYGDVCNAVNNIITLKMGVNCSQADQGSETVTYTMSDVVITTVSVGVQAQDMIISENTTMMFSSLACSDSGGAGGAGGTDFATAA